LTGNAKTSFQSAGATARVRTMLTEIDFASYVFLIYTKWSPAETQRDQSLFFTCPPLRVATRLCAAISSRTNK